MLSLLFGLLVLFIVVSGLRWFGRADPKDVKKAINWGGLSLILLIIVGLVVTGRMGAALAGLVVLFGWLGRILSVVQMGRQFSDLFRGRKANAGEGSSPPSRQGGAMSIDEAARILGVAPNANEEDVKAAYRRLMSQLHPDHGGSDYLAAKVNQAKDVMLKKK